jgi:hypothetical protein
MSSSTLAAHAAAMDDSDLYETWLMMAGDAVMSPFDCAVVAELDRRSAVRERLAQPERDDFVPLPRLWSFARH